jgi:hypothetical protein
MARDFERRGLEDIRAELRGELGHVVGEKRGSWLAREMETYPKRELRRSGCAPVSALIKTRSVVRPCELWLVTA